MTPFLARMRQAARATIARMNPVTLTIEGVEGTVTGDRSSLTLDETLRQGGGGRVQTRDCSVIVLRTDLATEPEGPTVTVSAEGEDDLVLTLDHVEHDEVAWTLFLIEPGTR